MKFKIFIISVTIFIGLLLTSYVYAANTGWPLEAPLPGVPTQISTPMEYIKYIFIFGLSLITFITLGMMMLGGIRYILAAGNVSKVEDAKDMITQALLGLGMLLVSYLLLRMINPDLINLKNPSFVPTSITGANFSPINQSGVQSIPGNITLIGKPGTKINLGQNTAQPDSTLAQKCTQNGGNVTQNTIVQEGQTLNQWVCNGPATVPTP